LLGQAARPRVRATLSIEADKAHLFTATSRLAVGTAGLIGEPYLELMPGVEGDQVVPPGKPMRGVDSVKFHVMFVQAAAVLQAIGGFVGVEEDLGLDEVGRAVASLMTTLNQLVGERQPELQAGISDLVSSSKSLRVILGEVEGWVGKGRPLSAAMVQGQESVAMVHRELPQILGTLKGSLHSLESLSTRADSVISDALLEEIVLSLRQTTDRVDILTRDVQSLVRMMKRGEGTVGGLMQDPQVYDDLKEMLRDLKKNPWKMLWRD
jgi:phospholipid/cholesterol/gamma-HCH transport system substrate-binding protein